MLDEEEILGDFLDGKQKLAGETEADGIEKNFLGEQATSGADQSPQAAAENPKKGKGITDVKSHYSA